jgi:hypothetical protein
MRRFVAGYLSAILTMAVLVGVALGSRAHHLPHSGKPCQLEERL